VKIYNEAFHAYMMKRGFTYVWFEADWWDCGDPESGPSLDGHPDYGVYSRGQDTYYISEDGAIEYQQWPEEWEE